VRKLRALAILIASIALTGIAATMLWSMEGKRKEYELFRFYLPWDDGSDTVTHVQSWVSARDKAIERVYVGADGRLYAGGRRIRFIGVNIGGAACFPRKEDAEKIAGRLAKFGINLVRMHGIDANWETVNIFGGYNAPTTRSLDPEALDRLDYFIAKLKDNGIYVNLNLLVARRFRAADGLPPEIEQIDWKDQHALIFIDQRVRELHKEYVRQLLTHRNPYTNTTYAEDPAIAFVEMANEMGAWFWYMLTDLVSRLPPTYKAELEQQWKSYIQGKYGSVSEFLARWGVKGDRAPALTSKMYWGAPDFVREAWLDFIYQLEAETYTELYDFVKREVGYRGLVVGSTCFFSPLGIQSRFDVIDAHAYWQHPEFPGTPWDPQNWYVVNEPMVCNPLKSTIVSLAGYRVYGKPFVVSEYDHPNPNAYGPEGVLLLATYAALQDWDGIVYFAYGSLDDWGARRLRGFFDIDQNPAKMALMIPAYMIFVRGDVEPASTYIAADLAPSVERQRLKEYDYADAYDAGLRPELSLLHRVAAVTAVAPNESTKKPEEVETPGEVKTGIFRSDNGQVLWDASEKNRCLLIVNTNRTVALAGFIGNRGFELGWATLEVGDTLLGGWGVIAFTTREDESFNNWSRMLMIAVSYVTNEGLTLRDYDGKRVLAVGSTRMREMGDLRGKKVTCIFQWGQVGDWGRGPTVVEGLEVTVRLRVPEDIEVWTLDNVGNRKLRVPVATDGEYKVFKVGPEYETIWYEIVRK
jgi:hypothetical protein